MSLLYSHAASACAASARSRIASVSPTCGAVLACIGKPPAWGVADGAAAGGAGRAGWDGAAPSWEALIDHLRKLARPGGGEQVWADWFGGEQPSAANEETGDSMNEA